MRYLRQAACAVFGMSAILAGCAEPRDALSLTEADNGRAVTIAVGECFDVHLKSNVTTGYEWQLVEMDASILENTDEEYVQDVAPPGMTGVGGTEIWDFTGRAPGQTDLRLEYRRPWEPMEKKPDDTFEIEVTVKAAK
jgi:inhibitor of cysteine peptidase